LRWTDGRFAFRPGVRSPRNTLTSSTETLLLQATQRADEISGAGNDSVDADSVLMAVTEHVAAAGSLARGGAPGHSEGYEFGPVTLLGDPVRGEHRPAAAPVALDTVSLSLSALD